MKVIFLKDVGGVGKRNTVKDVADGYALNFLIPNGFAQQATKTAVAELEANQQKEKSSHDALSTQHARDITTLKGAHIVIHAKANEHGHLYKQISNDMIAEAIKSQHKIALLHDSIKLNAPIKNLGSVDVHVALGQSTSQVTIEVLPEK